MLAGFVMLLTLGVSAQENRSDISLQGTGFFTKDTNGNGISRTTSDTGGFQVGYRYHINRWFSAEGDYGFGRNTQKYFGSFGESGVQADVHAVTGDLVVNLPLPIRRISTYALAGGGGLIFDPTGNGGGSVPGASIRWNRFPILIVKRHIQCLVVRKVFTTKLKRGIGFTTFELYNF